jgi:cytochrome P450
MHKHYPVILTAPERDQLKSMLPAGTESARKLIHARILLKAGQGPDGPGWVDQAIAEAREVSQPTIARLRKQHVEQGLESALNRRPPSRQYVRKLDGVQEAKLLAVAGGQPPAGHACWSLRLLADKLVELEIVVDAISSQPVRRTLNKTRSSRT